MRLDCVLIREFETQAARRATRGLAFNVSRFLQVFLSELRRRRILRALAIYAVSAWLVLQVAEVTFEPLGMPPGAMRALIILVLIGFPVTCLLAWLIEFGPNGFLFDLPLWPSDAERPTRAGRFDRILALALLGMLVLGVYTSLSLLQIDPSEPAPNPPAARDSIAVLPFDNFDGGSESDYFSNGLAEEILYLLADLPELDVAARTSSFQFRGAQVDVRKVAATLGVQRVLEGSVQRNGDRLRVNAQLIDGESGFQSWRASYERGMSDVFAIQREIASSVVAELKVALSAESSTRLDTPPTANLDAYLLFLQASELLRSSQDASTMRAADALFDRALALDRDFARALAGRCEVALRLYEIGRAAAEFEAAEAACTRAAQLDSGLNVDVQVAMARLYRFRGWSERAEQPLQQALQISPRNVDAHIELGALRMSQGRRSEAEASLLKAVDLKGNYWKAHEALAAFYYRSERYPQAVEAYSVVVRLAPGIATAHAGMGAAFWMLGDVDQARAAWDRSLALDPSRQAYTNIGLRYYYGGRFEEAAQMQRSALALAPDDHRVWGRLAESLRFIPGRAEESRAAYEKATELARANLDINGSDWTTRGLIGIYYAHIDQPEQALREVDRAVSESHGSAEALYYQALVRFQLGDGEGSIDALAAALAKDPQYRTFVETDPDFEPLRAKPRFMALLKAPD